MKVGGNGMYGLGKERWGRRVAGRIKKRYGRRKKKVQKKKRVRIYMNN